MATTGVAQGGSEGTQGNRGRSNGPHTIPTLSPGQHVLYLLDRSLSMGWRNCLVQARTELLHSLEDLPTSSPFQVLVFNRQVELLLSDSRNRWLQTDRGTVQRIREALSSLAPSDGTQLFLAIKEALVWRAQHLVLITDAEDLSVKEIMELTRFNAGRSRIHVLDMRWRPGQPGSLALQQLTLSNQGSYRQAVTPPG